MGVHEVTGPPRRAVFLDRDGVLNEPTLRNGKPFPPAGLASLKIYADARDALDALRASGFALVVVTNQPDVARGTKGQAEVEAIDRAVAAALPIDATYVCYHDGDECDCRKPKPGLLFRAAGDQRIDLARSFMVGDRWRDIEAGQAAGVRTILIDRHYAERGPSKPPDAVVSSLAEAASWILRTVPMLQTSPANSVPTVAQLKVKIFADGAEKSGMLAMLEKPYISGFTTNPTLMRKSGIEDYEAFAKDILAAIPQHPISLEVFADHEAEMERQARRIATWGDNVYVKIPVTNTKRESTAALVRRLTSEGVKLNVTALMTVEQVRTVSAALAGGAPAYISVFAGRIADTGRDPIPLMVQSLAAMKPYPNTELIWASPRELLNIFQADAIGCHIITVTNDVLAKLSFVGKDLDDYSLDTVKMFHDDARKANFNL